MMRVGGWVGGRRVGGWVGGDDRGQSSRASEICSGVYSGETGGGGLRGHAELFLTLSDPSLPWLPAPKEDYFAEGDEEEVEDAVEEGLDEEEEADRRQSAAHRGAKAVGGSDIEEDEQVVVYEASIAGERACEGERGKKIESV
jgi:hypothetical protein